MLSRVFPFRSSGRRQSRPRLHPPTLAPAGSLLGTVPDRRSTYESRTPCLPFPHAPPPRRKSPLLPQGRAEVYSAQAHGAADYGHLLRVQGTWGWRSLRIRGACLASPARFDGHQLWLREEKDSGGFAQVRVRGQLCFGQLGRGAKARRPAAPGMCCVLPLSPLFVP